MTIRYDTSSATAYRAARNRLMRNLAVAKKIIEELEGWSEDLVINTDTTKQAQFGWAGMVGTSGTFTNNTIIWHPIASLDKCIEYKETDKYRTADSRKRRYYLKDYFSIPPYIILIHEMFHALQYKRDSSSFMTLAAMSGNLTDPENLQKCEGPVSTYFGLKTRKAYECTVNNQNVINKQYKDLGWTTTSESAFSRKEGAGELSTCTGTIPPSPFLTHGTVLHNLVTHL